MKKEGNSLKLVIVSGIFGILAAVFGAFVGRETHKINIKVGGESKNMEYKLIQDIVNKNEITINNLEDRNEMALINRTQKFDNFMFNGKTENKQKEVSQV